MGYGLRESLPSLEEGGQGWYCRSEQPRAAGSPHSCPPHPLAFPDKKNKTLSISNYGLSKKVSIFLGLSECCGVSIHNQILVFIKKKITSKKPF
jgi:hypothetical protein